jgi:hypothetical protein
VAGQVVEDGARKDQALVIAAHAAMQQDEWRAFAERHMF